MTIEDLSHKLTETIWAALDNGFSKSDIHDCINQALDTWTPMEGETE